MYVHGENLETFNLSLIIIITVAVKEEVYLA
jgi:hypothetical protein